MADQSSQNINDALWSTPQAQPTQTQPQMIGGLFMPPMDVMALRNNMMMAQTTMASQQALQNSLQIAAYAQGMPNALPPSVTMQDPTIANYMLQNMYQMNPYMANFLGQAGSGGAPPPMNLVSPSYMVNPRMGVFRDMKPGTPLQTSSTAMFLRDISILGGTYSPLGMPIGAGFNRVFGERQFSPYESVMEERIGAARRMYQREESWGASALGLASLGAAFIPGVGLPASLAIDLGVAPVVGGISNAYFQRRAETNRIQEISRDLITRSNAGGFMGRGFSLAESSGMMREMRSYAAQSPFYNISDVMQVFEQGTNAGLFKFNVSPQNTMKQVKDVIQNIDIFMQLSGDADVRSAMERMGRLQNLGVGVSQMQSAVQNLRTYARLAGTSVEGIMQGMGGAGAQFAVQQGGPAVFGMTVGGMNQGLVNTYVQSGRVSPLQLSLRGGQEGLSQSATQAMINVLQQQMTYSAAAFTDWENGQFVFNQRKFEEYLKGGTIGGKSIGNINEYSMSRYQQYNPLQQQQFMIQQQDIVGEGLAGLNTPQRQISMMRSFIGHMKSVYPQVPVRNLMYQQFGMSYDYFDYIMGSEAEKDMANQQIVTQQDIEQKRAQKFRQQNTWTSRLGVWASESVDSTMNFLFDFDERARREQRRANEAAGVVSIYGAEPGRFGAAVKVLGGLGRATKEIGPDATWPGKTGVDSYRGKVIDSMREREMVSDLAKERSGYSGLGALQWKTGISKGGPYESSLYDIYEESQNYKKTMAAWASGSWQDAYRHTDAADFAKQASKYFGGGISKFAAKDFFSMTSDRQAALIEFVKESGNVNQIETLDRLELLYKSAMAGKEDATLSGYKKRFEDSLAPFKVSSDAQGKFTAYLAFLKEQAKIPADASAAQSQAFSSFASTMLSFGRGMNSNQILDAAKLAGVSITDPMEVFRGTTNFARSIGEVSAQHFSAFGFSDDGKQKIASALQTSFDYMKAIGTYEGQNFKFPGVWADPKEIEDLRNQPKAMEIMMKSLGADVAGDQAKMKEHIGRQFAIAQEGLMLDGHNQGSDKFTAAQYNLVAEIVRIARKYEQNTLKS